MKHGDDLLGCARLAETGKDMCEAIRVSLRPQVSHRVRGQSNVESGLKRLTRRGLNPGAGSNASDDDLRDLLAAFYAKRTLTHVPIDPKDCAEAILFIGGPKSSVTTGHLIPVDGGLPEAFLR